MHKLFVLTLVIILGIGIWTIPAKAQPSTVDLPKTNVQFPALELPKTKVNPNDGAEMSLIPAGEFLMGTSEEEIAAWIKAHPEETKFYRFEIETSQHKVNLDAYYMYKTEVTVAQYRKFCKATARKMPTEPEWKWQENHPIINVSWDDANAYTLWAESALPTEAQWEKAARGGDQRIFPWGDSWPPPAKAGNFADMAYRRKYPERSFIEEYDDGYAGISPVGVFTPNLYGLYDLAGNVPEWCADWYGDNYYKNSPTKNPTGPRSANATYEGIGIMRIIRGGMFNLRLPMNFRVATRGSCPQSSIGILGFRCVVPVNAQ